MASNAYTFLKYNGRKPALVCGPSHHPSTNSMSPIAQRAMAKREKLLHVRADRSNTIASSLMRLFALFQEQHRLASASPAATEHAAQNNPRMQTVAVKNFSIVPPLDLLHPTRGGS
jgi:hypothetical protein